MVVMVGLVLVGCSSVFRAQHGVSASHTLLGQYLAISVFHAQYSISTSHTFLGQYLAINVHLAINVFHAQHNISTSHTLLGQYLSISMFSVYESFSCTAQHHSLTVTHTSRSVVLLPHTYF